MSDTGTKERTFIEVLEVSGGHLVEQVKQLVAEGNVRRIRISTDDDFALEMPVTVGVIVGGVVMLGAPWLAVLGVVAALVTKVKVEVERDETARTATESARDAAKEPATGG
jgi:hypothetical protein